MRWIALLFALLWPASLAGQSVSEQADRALAQLQAASEQLEAADKKRERVQALTETIKAFEAGLSALREGMRQASIRDVQLREQLAARDAEIGQLLAVLLTIRPESSPDGFLHPGGITGAARAGMLLSEISPALNRNAAGLRRDLEDVTTIRALQTEAAARLQTGLTEVQTARIALSKAMADRTDLPQRFVADPARMALLADTAETLGIFASGLADISTEDAGWTPPPLNNETGKLDLPARGVVLRFADETDAAGVTRPGIVIATRPGALVTSPSAATIRYVGPLLDLGNVAILEPTAELLFIFAGLDIVYGEAGQIITSGTPLGLMGGLRPELAGNSRSTGGERAGAQRSETLYIEVRQENVPQDPIDWFRIDKDR